MCVESDQPNTVSIIASSYLYHITFFVLKCCHFDLSIIIPLFDLFYSYRLLIDTLEFTVCMHYYITGFKYYVMFMNHPKFKMCVSSITGKYFFLLLFEEHHDSRNGIILFDHSLKCLCNLLIRR